MSYNSEDILKRLEQIIVEYNKNRDHLDDDLISEMRASLSTGAYLFVESVLLPAMEESVATEIAERKAEVASFNRIFDELSAAGYSKSQAESIARKRSYADEEYLKAVEDNMNAKNIAKIYDTVLKQANQVLNSMAKRINFTQV